MEALRCTRGPVSEKEMLTVVGQSSHKYLCFRPCAAGGACSDDLFLLTRHSQVKEEHGLTTHITTQLGGGGETRRKHRILSRGRRRGSVTCTKLRKISWNKKCFSLGLQDK